MKKKLLSMLLAAVMVTALSVPAFAVDGDEATAPKGETGTNVNASTGAATVSGDGTTWNIANDDDSLAAADDHNGADINVWAKVVDSSTPTYKIDIAWGAMKFEYTSGEGTWDTTTHTYTGGTGAGAWTEASYLDGTNNKVTVTNHSNHAVDAGFAFAFSTNFFNDTQTSDNAVVGNFFADNTKAVAASKVLTGTHTGGAVADAAVSDKLTGSKVTLDTADKYNSKKDATTTDTATNVEAGARPADVFFAFSGTPDQGKGATLDTFKKVGVITVTVAPNTATQGNYGPYIQ